MLELGFASNAQIQHHKWTHLIATQFGTQSSSMAYVFEHLTFHHTLILFKVLEPPGQWYSDIPILSLSAIVAITQCNCLFSPSSPFNLTTLIAKTCEDQTKHRTLLLFIRVRNLTNAASTYAKTADVHEIHLLFGTCIGAPQEVTGPPGVDSVWHGMASCSAHGTVGQLDP